MRRHLSLGLHLFEHAIQKFYEIQKTRGQDDHVPIAANPAAFQEEQSAQRTIAFEKCQHHVDDNFELVGGRRYPFRCQPDGRVDLLPGKFETASSNPNLLLKCLMSWDWLVPAKRQIAAVVGLQSRVQRTGPSQPLAGGRDSMSIRQSSVALSVPVRL